MKSQHRHELAENDLSKILGRWMEKFDEHANPILLGIVIVAFIAAGIIYWTRTSESRRATGWTELASATSPEDFANVADAFAGSSVAPWARLRAANGFLQEGIRLSLTDRPASNDRLEQAREAFESIVSDSHPPAIREQALLGLAVTHESLSDGQTQPAIDTYQKLLEQFPETRFREFASARIDELKTAGAQEFYAWFHQQNPKPADMPVPNDRPTAPDASLESLLKDLESGETPGGSGGNPLESLPLTIPLQSDPGSSKSSEDADSSTAPDSDSAPEQPSDESTDDEGATTSPDAETTPDEETSDPEKEPVPAETPE